MYTTYNHLTALEPEHYSQIHPQQPPPPCSQNHSPSLTLLTPQGGSICILCFSNLLSNPNSPTFHISYALSQLEQAISYPSFLSPLLSFHLHLILSPLIRSLEVSRDDQIAKQVVDVVTDLCHAGGAEVSGEFVAYISEVICSASLVWSRRQLYSLHCLGVLLTRHKDTYACIKDKAALLHNLVIGLQLPSDEIQGEIMFVLYRLCILQYSTKDEEGSDVVLEYCPTILHLSLNALLKTQREDVRSNCLDLLKLLSQRGLLSNAFLSDCNMMDTCEADSYSQSSDCETNGLIKLFAEAMKSPLLSPDSQVQNSALDLIFNCLSREDCSWKQIQILVEENVADYVFEILRLSERKDQIVSSCVQVLDLLSTAEQAFKQRLAIGFTTLVSVLPLVAEVRCHPFQPQILKLILNGVTSFLGVVSTKIAEDISRSLGIMLKVHAAGEMSMLSEAFVSVCSIFVALMKSPSATRISTLIPMVQEASKQAILTSLRMYDQDPSLLLHSLPLLKEAYSFSHECNSIHDGIELQLSDAVVEVCQEHILPWFVTAVNGMEEDSILGVLEILHFLLIQTHDSQASELTQALLSHSWFSLSFGCLGLYPTENMKLRVYLMLSAIVEGLLGDDSGESIRIAAPVLPADPVDLLFLLAQKSTNNSELSSCQTAVLQILYISSLYDEMLADMKLVLTSLEQYLLSNFSHLLFSDAESGCIVQLLTLYGLCRITAKLNYQICYSPNAEQVFFQLLMERDWDLSSIDIHSSSLEWLFQQERICKSLSCQILKLCRKSCSIGNQSNSRIPNFQNIAQLTAAGGNFLPELLVLTLTEIVGEEMVTDDVILLLHFLSSIIIAFPLASDQLCIHGMGNAVWNLCAHLSTSSLEITMVILRFIFITLSSVQSQTINTDDDVWHTVTMKLLDFFTSTMMVNGWMEEHLIIIGILSLIMHHSTRGVLPNTSKYILMNRSLASLTRATVEDFSKNGSASMEQDNGTDAEQALVFLLLLYQFSLRSMQNFLPGNICWQTFLNPPEEASAYPLIGFLPEDICRFLHFGSPLVKLVASHSLLDLFNIIGQQSIQQTDLKCLIVYLRSIVSVLEGLVFHFNSQIAENCGICLSIILSWEIPGHHRSLVRNNYWCRMIVEELATALVVPYSASKLTMNHHRAALHIATALLRSKTVPSWMKSVFDEAFLSSIIEILSPNNTTTEVVILFQELLKSVYLKPSQIAKLNNLLQACRRSLRMEFKDDDTMGELVKTGITISCELSTVSEFLLQLMTAENNRDQSANNNLVEEIDLFSQLLTKMEEI